MIFDMLLPRDVSDSFRFELRLERTFTSGNRRLTILVLSSGNDMEGQSPALTLNRKDYLFRTPCWSTTTPTRCRHSPSWWRGRALRFRLRLRCRKPASV